MLKLQLVLMFMVLACMQPLSMDFPSSDIGESAFWVRVQMKVTGGTAPYRYYYTYMPIGWKQVQQYLYIPIAHVGFHKKYACRLVVRDRRDEELAVSLVFRTEMGRVFVEEKVYGYWEEIQDVEPYLASSFVAAIKPRVAPNPPPTSSPSTSEPPEKVQISALSSAQTSGSQDSNFGPNPSSTLTKPFSPSNQNSRLDEKSKGVIPPNQPSQQPINLYPPVSHPKLSTLSHKTTQQQVSSTIINKQLTSAVLQQTTPTIDHIFFRLPTVEQLDQIILSVDILAISKTIQQVIVSDLECSQKIAYLSEFFGRIQANVEMKKLSLAKMKLIEELAEEEIVRLEGEILRMEGQIQAMGLNTMRNKLQQEVILLEEAYEVYNTAVIQHNLAERRLPLYQKDRRQFQKQITLQRRKARILEERKINSTIKIQRLRRQLQEEEREYHQTLEEIEESKKKIQYIANSIDTVMKKATQASQLIVNAPHQLDHLKRNYLIQEVEVERIRSTISSYNRKQTKLKDGMNEIYEQIEEQKRKISSQQVEESQSMIESLERNLPNIQNQIDGLYYSCYEAQETQNQSGEYSMKTKQYHSYLQKAYGIQSPLIAIRQEEEQIQVLNLTHLTVYSSSWKQNYGEVILIAQDDQLDNAQESFTCLQPSAVESMVGEIKSIHKNLIIVQADDGNIYKLYLGSCSRIETTRQIPVVGDRIVFKGTKQSSLAYNIYSVSSLS